MYLIIEEDKITYTHRIDNFLLSRSAVGEVKIVNTEGDEDPEIHDGDLNDWLVLDEYQPPQAEEELDWNDYL